MALVPVIMAVTSVSKSYIDTKWSPLVSIALSLLASFALVSSGDVTTNVIQGILMGLAAAGLYSGGKTTLGAFRK